MLRISIWCLHLAGQELSSAVSAGTHSSWSKRIFQSVDDIVSLEAASVGSERVHTDAFHWGENLKAPQVASQLQKKNAASPLNGMNSSVWIVWRSQQQVQEATQCFWSFWIQMGQYIPSYNELFNRNSGSSSSTFAVLLLLTLRCHSCCSHPFACLHLPLSPKLTAESQRGGEKETRTVL